MAPVLAVILALTLAFVLTGLATRYSRQRGLLDHPGERHSHTVPTPRGGGAGLIAALIIVSLVAVREGMPGWWAVCVVPGVILLAVTGWWDDHRPLSAKLRFLVQVAAAIYLVACFHVHGLVNETWLLLLGVLFIVWMTNLYNFMDGSNGMAATQGVFGGLVLTGLFSHSGDVSAALLCLLLAASCAGFLPWNLGRARVFMGDVGSLSLGFIFGALLLYGAGHGVFSLPVALMVMALFLADSSLTLLARVMRGEQWYNAHRQHLYQRMIAQGWTHGRVLLLYQAINLMLVLPVVALAVHYPAIAWPAALVLGLVLGTGWYLSIKKIGVLA